MAEDIVERLRRWDDGRISTHYDGCWDSHPVCVILFAADAIEARDAEIERLRALITEWDAAFDGIAWHHPMLDPEGFRLANRRYNLAADALSKEARRER